MIKKSIFISFLNLMTTSNEKMDYTWNWKIPKDMAEESLWSSHSKATVDAGFHELWELESKITHQNRDIRLEAARLDYAALRYWSAKPLYLFELGLKDKDPEIQAVWLKQSEHIVLPESILRHLLQCACPHIQELLAERADFKPLLAKNAAPSFWKTLLSNVREKAKDLPIGKAGTPPKNRNIFTR
jgi:hypothetical protein